MAEDKPVLVIDPPNEMKFKGPFNAENVSCTLVLFNPTDKKIAYKVKTTAPKRYCVRPNNGIVEPRERVSIMITHQSFDMNPEEKAKHKFMVQSTFLDGPYDPDTIWKNTPPEKIVDAKLRCVFEPADEESQPAVSSPQPTKAALDASYSGKSEAQDSHGKSDHSKLQQELAELKREMNTLRMENTELKKSRPAVGTTAAAAPEGDSVQFRRSPECVSNPVLQELKKQEELMFRSENTCAFTTLHVLLSIFLAFLAGMVVTKFFSSSTQCK